MKDALALLNQLEVVLKREALWSERKPTATAMASQVPFSADLMAFEQWLQFIYLPKLREMLRVQSALPSRMEVAPAAELYLPERLTVIRILRHLDSLAAEQSR